MPFAVAVTRAMPAVFVTAVGAESVADGPFVGAAKATITPLIGLPLASVILASSGAANGWFTAADCCAPLADAIAEIPTNVLRVLTVAIALALVTVTARSDVLSPLKSPT